MGVLRVDNGGGSRVIGARCNAGDAASAARFARARHPRYLCHARPQDLKGALSAEEESLGPWQSLDQGRFARTEGALESSDACCGDREVDETDRECAAAKGGDDWHWSRSSPLRFASFIGVRQALQSSGMSVT